MEILGRENPLALVLNDIFNPTTANMELSTMNLYIQAARDDYYRNLEALKDFLKEYGSFTSPISKDVENYYNMTTGGLNDLFKFAQDAGVDLIRSQQGRNLIQRYIMSRPYAQLALIKQSAENASQYLKAYGELAARGLISDDMAKALDGDMSKWDTLNGSGVWSTLSPTQYKSYTDMLAPIKQMLKNEYKYLRTDKNRWKDIYGVSDDRVREALNAGISDLLAQPQMQYYLDTEFNGDKEALKEAMYGRLRASLGEDERDNAREKAIYEQSQANSRAAAERNLQLQLAGLKNGNKQEGATFYRMNVWNDYMDKIGIRSAKEYSNGQIARAYQVVSGMKIYDPKTKKTVRFGDLSKEEQDKFLSKNPNSKIAKKLESSEYRFIRDRQDNLVKDYMNKGGKHVNSSMALAFTDNAKQFVSQYDDGDKKYDANGHVVGYKRGSNQFFTIGEVSSRRRSDTGVKTFASRSYDANNGRRGLISYFDVGSEKDNMIIQYENYDHSYHGYRKVQTYDDNGKYLGDMWMETWDPRDMMTSSVAQAHNARAQHDIDISNKSNSAPVNTVYQ